MTIAEFKKALESMAGQFEYARSGAIRHKALLNGLGVPCMPHNLPCRPGGFTSRALTRDDSDCLTTAIQMLPRCRTRADSCPRHFTGYYLVRELSRPLPMRQWMVEDDLVVVSARTCHDCPADISHRQHNARRCETCIVEHNRKLTNARIVRYHRRKRRDDPAFLEWDRARQRTPAYRKNRRHRRKWDRIEANASRVCADCSASLSERTANALRCFTCAAARRKARR